MIVDTKIRILTLVWSVALNGCVVTHFWNTPIVLPSGGVCPILYRLPNSIEHTSSLLGGLVLCIFFYVLIGEGAVWIRHEHARTRDVLASLAHRRKDQ